MDWLPIRAAEAVVATAARSREKSVGRRSTHCLYPEPRAASMQMRARTIHPSISTFMSSVFSAYVQTESILNKVVLVELVLANSLDPFSNRLLQSFVWGLCRFGSLDERIERIT